MAPARARGFCFALLHKNIAPPDENLFACKAVYMLHNERLELVRIVHRASFIRASFGDSFRRQVTSIFYFTSFIKYCVLPARSRPLSFVSHSNTAPSHKNQVKQSSLLASRSFVISRLHYYFSNLCGLCIGQFLSLQRSGMVFVPSIISFPHIGQRLPVGRVLVIRLQSG